MKFDEKIAILSYFLILLFIFSVLFKLWVSELGFNVPPTTRSYGDGII